REAELAQRVRAGRDLIAAADDRGTALGLEAQDVQTLAGRDPDAAALADGETADAGMHADRGAVRTLDRPGDEGLGGPIAHEVAVVAADETDVHALGLRGVRKTEPCREGTGLGLVGEL